jgi:hypothetical protein
MSKHDVNTTASVCLQVHRNHLWLLHALHRELRTMTQLHTWKCVFTADHPLQAATMATAMEAEGLTPQLRGMELWGVAVEILFSEGAAPSVWVPEMQVEQATLVVQRMRQASAPKQDDWRCEHCAEKVPASFESCWQCGHERPPADPPSTATGIITSEGN